MSQGGVGVIEVRGPNVFKGYWQMPEKTAAELRDDEFFITGDLGQIDADGYNIYPKEIELVLDEQTGVLESAVIGVPHPDFGETVLGIMVAQDGQGRDTDAIMETVKGPLARFEHPRRLVVVDSLPRNTMGKVQKNALREACKDLFAST